MNITTQSAPRASCDYCGRKNPELFRTCPGCGTPLAEDPPELDSKPRRKSTRVAVCLTILFGPLGLFYASITAGAAMLLISVPIFIITKGGLWFEIGCRSLCAIWAYVEVSEQLNPSIAARRSKRLLAKAARLEDDEPSKAIVAYLQIAKLFPNTTASREAERNIQTLKQHV